jgi:outer membrane protein assembly factor BamB
MRLKLVVSVWLLVVSLLVGCSQPSSAPNLVTATAVPPTPLPEPTIEPATAVPESATALTKVWTSDVGDAINHPPLPVGDLVITVPTGGPVTALNTIDGSVAWEYAPAERIWDRAYVSDGRSFFISIEGGQIAALDAATGDVRWQKELGINAQTPLYLADGVLYVPTTFVGPGTPADPSGQAKLFALNPEDGTELWSFTSDNYILQTPARFGETIYVGGSYEADVDVDEGGPMRLYALSAADGTELWAYESLDGYPKQLYATETAVAYIAYQDFTVGVAASDGQMLWRRDTGNWVPTLSGTGETIYFGSANTVVHAQNMADGIPAWQFNIPEGTFNYVLGAPVPVDDTLYFLTQQGDMFALELGNGRQRWHYPTGIIAARTNPTISDDLLFLGDADGVVHAYTINR